MPSAVLRVSRDLEMTRLMSVEYDSGLEARDATGGMLGVGEIAA